MGMQKETWGPLVVKGFEHESVRYYMVNQDYTKVACLRGRAGRRLRIGRVMRIANTQKHGPVVTLTLGGSKYQVPIKHLKQGVPVTLEAHMVGRRALFGANMPSPDLDGSHSRR